jgi:hypothetical protein
VLRKGGIPPAPNSEWRFSFDAEGLLRGNNETFSYRTAKVLVRKISDALTDAGQAILLQRSE